MESLPTWAVAQEEILALIGERDAAHLVNVIGQVGKNLERRG